MKRFWLVLLSLGLLTVFSTSALAVDVQFSGEFYVAGAYLDKIGLSKDPGSADKGFNTSFFYQRLRVRTDFIAAPGLKVVTRFDALERVWGGTRTSPGTSLAVDSAGTTAENQNIAFDWAYIEYASPVGIISAGYMPDSTWGTIFSNSYGPAPAIKWSYTTGPVTVNVKAVKVKDQSYDSQNPTATTSDLDNDKYVLEGVYQWNGGKAGLQGQYFRYAENRQTGTPPSTKKYYTISPFAIAKIGPVDVQAELTYAFGKYRECDDVVGSDITMQNLVGWIDATATFGPVYFGGTFAYVSGDDPNTTDKQEGGTLSGGRDWSPTLIMWNWDRSYWMGDISSSAASPGFSSAFANGFLYQGRVGVKPIPQLDFMAAVTYASVDKKPTNYIGSSYGWEADLVGTYKITNNLTYMLGAGYLWTGDYFKGSNNNNGVVNDFIVTNKLTLTF